MEASSAAWLRNAPKGPALLCVVAAAPTVFRSERSGPVSRTAILAANAVTATPLALLFRSDDGGATAAPGAEPQYAIYLVRSQAPPGSMPTLYPVSPAVVSALRARLKQEGADPDAVLYAAGEREFPVLPRPATKRRKVEAPASELTAEAARDFVRRVAPTVGLHVSKRKRAIFFREKASESQIAADLAAFFNSNDARALRVKDNLLAQSLPADEGALLRVLNTIVATRHKKPSPSTRAAAALLDPGASYADISRAFSEFLQSKDERVPTEVRRLASGLAPYADAKAKRHFGTIQEIAPKQPDAPFDARDALITARAWSDSDLKTKTRHAINYSVHLWNSLFS